MGAGFSFSSKEISTNVFEPSGFSRNFLLSKNSFTNDTYETKYPDGQAPLVLVIGVDESELKMMNGKMFSTGNNPFEALVPMMHFKAAGMTFDFATVSGKPMVIETWGFPPKDPSLLKFYNEYKAQADAPKKIADISPTLEGYAAIFIPGGHGTMINLPDCVALGNLLHAAHEKSLPTVALCHGPVALLSTAVVPDKKFAYADYKIQLFPDGDDTGMIVKSGYLPGNIPYFCGEKLKKEGIILLNTKQTGAASVDRELITGDGPGAANNLGKLATPIIMEYFEKNQAAM